MAAPKKPAGWDYSKEVKTKNGRLPGLYSDYLQVPRSWVTPAKTDPSGKKPSTPKRLPEYVFVGRLKPNTNQ